MRISYYLKLVSSGLIFLLVAFSVRAQQKEYTWPMMITQITCGLPVRTLTGK